VPVYFLTIIRYEADLTDWMLDRFGIWVLQSNCDRPHANILHACLNVHSYLLLDHA